MLIYVFNVFFVKKISEQKKNHKNQRHYNLNIAYWKIIGTNTSDNIPREDGLPSAREVSNEVFDSAHNQHFSTKHSITMVWFGQFLAHDIALSKTHEGKYE